MHRPSGRRATGLLPTMMASATAACLTLAACGSDDSSTPAGQENDGDGQVTITVGNLPTSERAEAREAFLETVAQFEDAYPDITIEPDEWEWNKPTFNAQLAGGTLPTTFQVPYTEPRGLVERKQIADITAEFEADEDLVRINDEILSVAQDADGNIYGVPTWGYTIALVYNRDLFEEAGLDPDNPPATWEDVRDAAVAVSDATGVAGFSQMSQGGFGGWMLSAMLYSFGGSVQEPDGEEYHSSFNSTEAHEVLGWLRSLRWDDDAMGDKLLYDQEELRRDFAAGQVGMFLDGADAFQPLTTNFGFDPEAFGITTLPQAGGAHGTLGGGNVAVVSPNASPEERAAALEWIKFRSLRPLLYEDAAVADAEVRVAEGLPVGAPTFPIVDVEQYEVWQGWIEPYINTPQENFEPYVITSRSLPVIPEPPVAAQDVYAALATVVQAVLTREDADIDDLLDDAERAISGLLADQG